MSASEFTKAEIAAFLERVYGLSSPTVTAIPGGYTSRCFQVRCLSGAWVLKTRVAGGAGPSRPSLRRSLRLISEMIGLRPALRLPEPAPTRRGALTARLPGGGAALYRLVPGLPAPHLADAPASLVERIGEAAAEIHALTPRLTVEIPHGRRRQLPRLRRLDRTLSALPRLSGHGAARLRAVAGPHVGALRGQLARWLELQRLLPDGGTRDVLRHGDLSGDNLAVEASSPLGVLDWDEAALDAPETEFGLFLLDGGKIALQKVLSAYARAGGFTDLEPDRIELAAIQRHLEDLAIRFERALGPDPVLATNAVADVAGWGVLRTIRLQTWRPSGGL